VELPAAFAAELPAVLSQEKHSGQGNLSNSDPRFPADIFHFS